MNIDIFLLSPEEADRTLQSILVCQSAQATMLGVAPLDCTVAAVVAVVAAAIIAIVVLRTAIVAAVAAAPVAAVVCY
jgi:hypothetical protein